ncbi:hypothetical protein SAMN02745116_00377 [Pilibacter termitis]|uniref:Uncharacterized protein n=1 Tax=Pilibacter termitis TaxID=263852 RepID=A0A1T4KTE6_9ENTE|nr:hypothetical protein SAMN02745116_00377 [Pilibacter termitis]
MKTTDWTAEQLLSNLIEFIEKEQKPQFLAEEKVRTGEHA